MPNINPTISHASMPPSGGIYGGSWTEGTCPWWRFKVSFVEEDVIMGMKIWAKKEKSIFVDVFCSPAGYEIYSMARRLTKNFAEKNLRFGCRVRISDVKYIDSAKSKCTLSNRPALPGNQV